MNTPSLQYFNTQNINPGQRCTAWQDIVSQVFFQLDVTPQHMQHYQARLSYGQFGCVQLVSLQADTTSYRRTAGHLNRAAHGQQEEFLITMPVHNNVCFSQLGREIICHSGNFLLQRSHEPYHFYSCRPIQVYVLKVAKSQLKQYLPDPENYCALDFNGQSGIGLLFRQHIFNSIPLLADIDTAGAEMLSKQLLELFAYAAAKDDRILHSQLSSIRQAHLRRIEAYVLKHLDRAELNPAEAAAACGISVRYLHNLFRDTNTSFSYWLKQQRLESAHRQLSRPNFKMGIAHLAYRLGFTDQSHFSKAYKQYFHESPSDTLFKSRQKSAG